MLFYRGPIVLKNILLDAMYKHFLLLNVACRILCTEELHEKFYLRKGFQILLRFYGPLAAVLNMHNLIDKHGMHFESPKAFRFESLLGKLKKLARTPNLPLEQVRRHLAKSNAQR